MSARKVYFGWYVVAAAVAIYALLLGTTFASFGLYILPVSREFGLSRADTNTGLIILNLGNALLAPVIGRLLDRVSVRRLMMVCALMLGGSLVAIGMSHSLALNSALIAIPVGAGVLGGGTISISVLLARWFEAHRGRAMALAALGMSLGGIAVSPLVGHLIETQGWRAAVMITGGGSGLVLVLLAFALRDWPGPDDVEVRGQTADKHAAASSEAHPAASPVPEMTRQGPLDFLRMRLFWMLALGIGLGSGISQGLTISLVPIALEAGLTTMQGAGLISAMGVTSLIATLALAAWGDRIDRTTLLSLVILSIIVPCALMLVAKSYVALFATALVIGFSLAALAPVYIALVADRFGLAAFGTVRGLFVPIMSLFGALSLRFIGEVYDHTGNYEAGLWTYQALIVVAAGLIYSTRPRAVNGPITSSPKAATVSGGAKSQNHT